MYGRHQYFMGIYIHTYDDATIDGTAPFVPRWVAAERRGATDLLDAWGYRIGLGVDRSWPQTSWHVTHSFVVEAVAVGMEVFVVVKAVGAAGLACGPALPNGL
jgi:hypothetical protein